MNRRMKGFSLEHTKNRPQNKHQYQFYNNNEDEAQTFAMI